MKDPGTWTTVWGLIVGAGVGWAEEDKGENCDNCNGITIKMIE